MKATDRTVLLGLVVVGLAAAFWFLALSPKREEASELENRIASENTELQEQEALVAAARAAQDQYEENYSTLVTLGKAAPADGDTPGLLEQLSALAEKADTTFDGLQLSADSGAAPAPATPPPATTEAATPPGEAATAASATPAPAPTEATAASLPLGAGIGPAGLAVLPYELTFTGDFFEISDLMQSIDRLVGSKAASVEVGGRLLTVNSFEMAPADAGRKLDVTLSVTSYVLPESQGLTAGATETAPPATVPAATTTPAGSQP